MTVQPPDRERVVQAVEAEMRRVLETSVASTDQEWRRDAEQVADAALRALDGEGS